MSATDATPALVIREAADGTPWWEAKWRRDGRQVKRRIANAPAWAERVEINGVSVWRARGGRAGRGTLSRDRAAVLASQLAGALDSQARATVHSDEVGAEQESLVFRQVAHEWLAWLRDVKGCKPSTYVDYSVLLREAGHPYRRGGRVSAGRIMLAFGDRDVRAISTRDVSSWLRELDAQGLSPRNVNKHRQVVCAVLGYACREDTYDLTRNVAANTDKRHEPPPAALDYYEAAEVEALALAVADGSHRSDQTAAVSIDERLMRVEEDARDADFFRVLFFTGMRLSELLALRWADVDLDGRAVMVRRNVSAGQEVSSKSGKTRFVPLTRGAVEALRRQATREDFVGLDDYVFASRFGGRLDASALRRRYHGAREAAGLRNVKLHGLRHAAGSIYARQATAVEVRDFLGHAKLSTTDRYVSARMSPEALARLDEAFEGPTADRT